VFFGVVVVKASVKSVAFIWISEISLMSTFKYSVIIGFTDFYDIFGFMWEILVHTFGVFHNTCGMCLIEYHSFTTFHECNSQHSGGSFDLVVIITSEELMAIVWINEESFFLASDFSKSGWGGSGT